MCLDLVVMFCIRFFVTVYEQLFVWRGKLRKLRNFLGWATDYEDWASAAQILDMHLGNDGWKSEVESDLYDFKLIIKTTNRLRRAREGGDITRLMQLLSNHACKRNFAGCHNESLFSHSYFGSKAEVERFYAEVQRGIEVVRDADIPDSEKRAFLKVVSRNFGRTALCLSGGAAFAYYHMGVLKAFFEQGVLPDVISGSSAGSLMAALVCTRTDAEIVEDGIFTSSVAKYISVMHDGWSVRIKRFWETGAMFDSEDGFRRMEYACKGMTFKESYQISGRILCITVVPDDRGSTSPPKVLNYLTAPDVLISSAIVASSAVPGILVPSRLLCKTLTGEIVPWHGSGRRWRDGSIRTDIPDLSMLNIGCTIVSQVNPHITVFFYEGQGSAGCPTAHRAGLGWRGGFIAASLMSLLDYDLKKWLNLIKDLQLLPPVAATDISSVFLQKFEGTVTVLPANDWRFMDWVQVLADPDEARMDICFRKGATRAYPKVHMIECRMRVEKEIKLLRRECAAGLEDDTESDAGPAARGFRKRDGALFCSNGHKVDEYREEVDELDPVAGSLIGRKSRKARTRKISERKATEKRPIAAQHLYEAFQQALRMQALELIKEQGFPAEYEMAVLNLWIAFVSATGMSPGQRVAAAEDGDDNDDNTDADINTAPVESTPLPAAITQLSWSHHLIFLYLGAVEMRLPVLLSDLLKWAGNGRLSYLSCYDALNLRFTSQFDWVSMSSHLGRKVRQ
ncbi:hypothetical protein HK101_001878 [Irineochytrium annulatum]|nr:hypothetical protein HK101_001878 [Irineochytrium annulatum]